LIRGTLKAPEMGPFLFVQAEERAHSNPLVHTVQCEPLRACTLAYCARLGLSPCPALCDACLVEAVVRFAPSTAELTARFLFRRRGSRHSFPSLPSGCFRRATRGLGGVLYMQIAATNFLGEMP